MYVLYSDSDFLLEDSSILKTWRSSSRLPSVSMSHYSSHAHYLFFEDNALDDSMAPLFGEAIVSYKGAMRPVLPQQWHEESNARIIYWLE